MDHDSLSKKIKKKKKQERNEKKIDEAWCSIKRGEACTILHRQLKNDYIALNKNITLDWSTFRWLILR